MVYISDDLSLYTDKRYRSSEIVLAAWSLIEDSMLYSMGLAKSLIISIFIDNESIIFTCSSNYNVICSARKTFVIDHILTIVTDLSITATINLNLSKENRMSYKKCSFYYEKGNKEDDGSIEIECDASYNINSYIDFKIELITAISRELQFLIHRNIINSDISKCNIAHLDSEFEVLRVYSKIKNKKIYDLISNFLSLNKINTTDANKLQTLLKRINYD